MHKNFENKNYRIWLEKGIIHAKYYSEIIDIKIAEESIRARIDLSENKNYPVCIDIRSTKTFTREARERLSKNDAGDGLKAGAIIINSKVQEVLYNFFNAIYKAPVPAKVFTDKEKALKWLEQFR